MKKVSIYMFINNEENPYEYRGDGVISKDIIEYSDKEFNYIYDLGINRLVKYNKNNKIIIDFDKEEILLGNNGSLTLKIEVKEKNITENKIQIKYQIDKKIIEFNMEIEVQ